jgi:hypothetical protein
MTKFNSARFSSILDPDPKGRIEENQAPFRAWGKTDFPRNLVWQFLSCTIIKYLFQ